MLKKAKTRLLTRAAHCRECVFAGVYRAATVRESVPNDFLSSLLVYSVVRLIFTTLILAALGAGLAGAQNIDFSLFVTVNGSSGTVANDNAVAILGVVGTQTTATVVATYTGSTQATISKPTIIGSSSLTLTVPAAPTYPLVVAAGQTFTFVVTYAPTDATLANAQVEVPYTEPGTATPTVSSAILLQFQGAAPAFTLTYVLQSDNNAVKISPGGTVPFGSTQLNTTANANVDINNTGSGPGVITGVTPPAAGSPFKVEGIPLLPYTLAAGTTLPLIVQYNPTAVENDTAQIVIAYQGGATATVNLTGSGITSTFTYKYLVQGASTAVTPGGTITFPGADVGSTSGLIVQVTNTGSATGTISSVSTQGPFTLTNPVTLPATLTTGNSFSVPLTFTPTQVGTQTGEVLIGNDFFNLSGQGLGPNLTYAYTSGTGTTTVNPATGGAVVFSPIAVGQSEHVTFTVTDSGSQSASISLIGATPANGPFTVSAAPLSLAPGQSGHFTITFTPTLTGVTNGDLVLNTTMIPLIGSGTAPPALPSYSISGPSGTAAPASQSNVSLTLANSYPVDLTGVLTITTSGNQGSDPDVQFSSGGRTVDFAIPADSTSANFAGQGPQIPVQTGTVAETVTLTPSFATAGGVNVTPSSPATLQFSVASSAPGLESVGITNESDNSFDLVLIGYSTPRSLTSLTVTFNPASGFNIGTSQLTIDVSQASAAWFQSSSSTAFGGQFQITTPFTLQGTVKIGQTLLQAIASVTATVSNTVGTSNSLAANVQ